MDREDLLGFSNLISFSVGRDQASAEPFWVRLPQLRYVCGNLAGAVAHEALAKIFNNPLNRARRYCTRPAAARSSNPYFSHPSLLRAIQSLFCSKTQADFRKTNEQLRSELLIDLPISRKSFDERWQSLRRVRRTMSFLIVFARRAPIILRGTVKWLLETRSIDRAP